MRVIVALVISLTVLRAQPDPVRAGVMESAADGAVIAVEGAPLSLGTAVTVISTEPPQQAWRASIAARLPASDVMKKHLIDGPFYAITAEAASTPLPRWGVVVVGRAQIARVGEAVVLRVGDPAREVRVRSCASMEGLHLTVWGGVPLSSPKLWHAYYYVGYDMVPNCTPGDVGGIAR